MVTSNSSAIRLGSKLQRFFIVLTSAACEWFLIFWLLIEAILSFLLKKFASYCKLQIPCIFCSRLDHILGKESPGFYQGLLCNNHKLELSSLLSCGSYGKLAWSHDICEECLLSSARTSMPNYLMHTLLMHKSGCRHHERKWREKFSRSVSPHHLKKFGFDHLSHMGYSELKTSSDSESDFPISYDYEGKSIIQEKKVPKFDPSLRSSCDEHNDTKSAVTDNKNDASEKNYQEDDKKSYPSSIPELISLDDFPPLCNAMEDSNGSSVKKCELRFPNSQDLNSSVALSELMSLIDVPSSINFPEVGPNPLQRNCCIFSANGSITIDSKSAQVNVNEKNFKSVTSDNANLNGSSHPTINGEGNDSYEFMEEKLDLKGCDSIEEAKTLHLENTFAQGILSYPKLMSQECESKAIEDSFSNGVQNALAMNKIESGSALSSSLDESIISEIEGESTINHLKRQIEQYKTKISALYVELEEERNASEVAANQAMAMITRLQEEKALLHMEALQYLRMMEEQAEHDVEALEKANDLLAERDKEIQDLEAELEILRIMYLEEVATDVTQEKTSDLHRDSKIAMDTGICEKDYVEASSSLMFTKVSNIHEEPIASKYPLMEFGNEKLFISQCLRDLERKLVEFGCQQDSSCTFDGDIGEQLDTKVSEEQFECKEESQKTNAEMNGVDFSLQKEFTTFIGSCQEEENCISSNEKDQDVRNNKELPPVNGHNLYNQHEKIDLVTLSNEISDLNERLEALETDWNFLEHTLNSLEAGKEGLHFVREISYHLQELRKNCMS